MSNTNRTFPDFDDPPVVETVLGVEFAPLEKWGIPHFGLFWHEIKAEYSHFEIQPPLGPVTDFEIDWLKMPVRCWFYDESQTKLLQIQNSRFLYNWRKYFSKTEYPRYENTRTIFESQWIKFCSFLTSNQIAAPNVQRCEITYVNHIEKGYGWETIADLPNIFPLLTNISSTDFLPAPDVLAMNISYSMPENQGRLNIQVLPGIRQEDGKEILQFQLTAVGNPNSSELREILNWFDFAREYLIKSFVDFTSVKMHEIWKKKERT